MNDMNDDFELPPLPKETVFSSEVGDIDEESDSAAADDLTEAVAAPSMTDMDGNPAEPPPAEDYKSANRRETVIREMAELPPQKSAAERRQEYLDEVKKEREQLQAFKKDAVMFFGCFIALALIYLAADPTPLPMCSALVEAGIAWLIVRGSQIARLMLLIMLPINTALGAASFGGAFDRFAWFMTEIHVRGFLPDNFKKTAYLIMAVVSAGLFVFLLFNRRISTYCSDPENEIDDILSHGVKRGRRRRRFKYCYTCGFPHQIKQRNDYFGKIRFCLG